ncbi:MAG: hypothetical protein AB1Z23_11005 [Eubacteriales bacterium]
MNKGSIFFISFIVLSVLVIATTYSISYVQKQDHIEMGIGDLAELTGLDVEYRSFPNLEKYDKAFWFQDEHKNDYELDMETLAFQRYRYAGKAYPAFISTESDMKENTISTAKNIYPSFFNGEYTIDTEVLDADQVTKGYSQEQIIYISQKTSDDTPAQTFKFVILDGEIYEITLYQKDK